MRFIGDPNSLGEYRKVKWTRCRLQFASRLLGLSISVEALSGGIGLLLPLEHRFCRI